MKRSFKDGILTKLALREPKDGFSYIDAVLSKIAEGGSMGTVTGGVCTSYSDREHQ